MKTWKEDETGIVTAGDVGGDVQVGEAYSRRFVHTRLHGRLITVTAYPVQGDDTTPEIPDGVIRLQVQTELMVCRDPEDPGSTEVWSDIEYSELPERFDVDCTSVAHGEALARGYLASLDPALHFGWDGKPGMLPSDPRHTHYTTYGPPFWVPGTLLDCDNPTEHSPLLSSSELWADYRYSPAFGNWHDTGLPSEMEQRVRAAYMTNRQADVVYAITDVVADKEYTYRVSITNRTAYSPDSPGPTWHTEEYGLYPDGYWHGIPVNPHPGYEHWLAFCPNCGY